MCRFCTDIGIPFDNWDGLGDLGSLSVASWLSGAIMDFSGNCHRFAGC